MNPNHKDRKQNRLNNYDYSDDGYYFVTICTKDRLHRFGDIENGEMKLNNSGEIVKNCWLDLPNHYMSCKLDEFIIMPNHFHGIINIDNSTFTVGTGLKPVPTDATKTHGLSEMIRAFKTFSSRRINEKSNDPFAWQRSFHDRIIRNEQEYLNVKNYIKNNPMNWENDENY